MKTIIAGTDLKPASRSCVNYAAHIAHANQWRLVLLHSVHPTLPTADELMDATALAEIKKERLRKMKRMGKRLEEEFSGLKIEYVCNIGLAADDLAFYADRYDAELVVAGMRRQASIGDKLFGTVTTSLVHHAARPVLCIQENQKFRKVSRIVFASDYHPLHNEAVVSRLRKIASCFDAEILVLHVFRNKEDLPDFSEAYEGLKIEYGLKGCRHSFHAITASDTVEGITTFAASTGADMVAMIPHNRPLLEKLFRPSASAKMARYAKMPLLTINDR